MERWQGRVALVTGASSGIGASIAESLVKHGMIVVGMARRVENIEALSKRLSAERGKLYAVRGDVTDEENIRSTIAWIHDNLKCPVHVLVNNAFQPSSDTIITGDAEVWRRSLDTNVVAPSVCAREAIKSMRAHGFDDGHIFNINSILGLEVRLYTSPMYTASKHAVSALTQTLRKQLAVHKSNIRVTSINPGLVRTEATSGVPEDIMDTALLPSDIADAVLFALSLRQQVHVSALTIVPRKEFDGNAVDALFNSADIAAEKP